jgi:hypothetical protein
VSDTWQHTMYQHLRRVRLQKGCCKSGAACDVGKEGEERKETWLVIQLASGFDPSPSETHSLIPNTSLPIHIRANIAEHDGDGLHFQSPPQFPIKQVYILYFHTFIIPFSLSTLTFRYFFNLILNVSSQQSITALSETTIYRLTNQFLFSSQSDLSNLISYLRLVYDLTVICMLLSFMSEM